VSDDILRQVEQIIDDEAAVQTLMELFGLGHRQAAMALQGIRRNFAASARKAGMPLPEFIRDLDTERKMAIFGFCTGAVAQRDKDLGLDPDTGQRQPGPDYEI
jgi:hypothetical protein